MLIANSMGFRKNIAFTKLGLTISKIENELIYLAKKVESDIEVNGEVPQLTKDIQIGVHEYMTRKLIDVIEKYEWPMETPYVMAQGSLGTYKTTLGALVEELANKFMKIDERIKKPLGLLKTNI